MTVVFCAQFQNDWTREMIARSIEILRRQELYGRVSNVATTTGVNCTNTGASVYFSGVRSGEWNAHLKDQGRPTAIVTELCLFQCVHQCASSMVISWPQLRTCWSWVPDFLTVSQTSHEGFWLRHRRMLRKKHFRILYINILNIFYWPTVAVMIFILCLQHCMIQIF